MRSAFLVVLLSLAGAARAQVECVNVPLCFPPYSPAMDSLRFFEDGKPTLEVAAKCDPKFPLCSGAAPWWDTTKGNRTSRFYCSVYSPKATLTVRMARAGVETLDSYVVNENGDPKKPCWNNGATLGPPLHVADLDTPTERLAKVAQTCLGDSGCAAFVIQKCIADPDCQKTLANTMNVDFDGDGQVTFLDGFWWQWTFQRTIK